MSRLTYIYCLLDPGTLEKRYVGKSMNVAFRLKQHMDVARLQPKCHADYWKISLSRRQVIPILQIIETTTEESWPEREAFWINKLFEEGCPLTNSTSGSNLFIPKKSDFISHWGVGLYTPERRDKAAQRMKKLWEHRKASGYVPQKPVWMHTPEVLSKKNAALERRSLELGSDYSTLKGYCHTPGAKARMSFKHKAWHANRTPEQKRAAEEKCRQTLAQKKAAGYISPKLGQKQTPEFCAKMKEISHTRKRNSNGTWG